MNVTTETTMALPAAEALGLDIAEIDQRLADNYSLPTRCYWDPEIFAFEQEAIFAKRWQFMCPINKLANPDDVAVRQVGKYPIVVTRDRNGKLHGFLNICRHRGYTVAEHDQSKCLRLVCRYHTWSYNLDGSLANAPDAEGEAGFDKEALGLLPVAVEQWGPMIMVHPDPGARSFRETNPILMQAAEEAGFKPDMSRYTPVKEIEYEIETNWKLWYDNGTECYHCPNIHGASFGDAFNVAPEDTTIRLEENFSSYTSKGNPNPKANGLSAENYISFQVFPGLVVVLHDDILHMTAMTPLAPGKTRHSTFYFGEEDADPARVEGWVKIWHDTYCEDNVATAIQYNNLKSAGQPYNRYVAGREYAAQHFNAMIWVDYKAALAA